MHCTIWVVGRFCHMCPHYKQPWAPCAAGGGRLCSSDQPPLGEGQSLIR